MKRFLIFSSHNLKAIRFVILTLCLLHLNVSNGQGRWSVIGPGGGGWIPAITVLPDAQHTVLVACDVGGIYKSTNRGGNWSIMDSGLTDYFIQEITYDPKDPDLLYLAGRGGVFKSTDGGAHWVNKRNGFPEQADFNYSAPINTVVVDPIHTNIVYAGVGVSKAGYDFNPYHWNTSGIKGTVFKSMDFGESWTPLWNNGIDTSAMIYDLAIDPSSPNTLYAATDSGLYKSVDAAISWLPINAGLPGSKAMRLAINPITPSELYVTLWAEPGSSQWEGGIYKSTNGGGLWTAMNEGLPQMMGNESGFTCNYPNIIINPRHPEILYTGNVPWTPDPGVYKSVDGGAHWEWVSRPDPPDKNVNQGWITEHGVTVMSLAIDPQDGDQLYFGTSTHVIASSNAGATWEQKYSKPVGNGYWKSNGMETTVVQTIAIDQQDPKRLYAGYWDIGFFKSIDGGQSFKKSTQGMVYDANTFDVVIDPQSSATLYAASGWWETNEGELYKSTDYGETWQSLSDGLPNAQIWSIALDANSPMTQRTLYAACYDYGIYKSIDGGRHWVPSNHGLGVKGNLQIRKIVIDPSDSQTLYAGFESKFIEAPPSDRTIQGGLFKSSDGGANWKRIDGALPQLNVWDILIASPDGQTIYTAVSEGYDHSLKEEFPGGVYKSTDGGTTWMRMSEGMGDSYNLNVTALTMDPLHPDTLFATTSDDSYHDNDSGRGIFKTTNGGSTWSSMNEGLGVLYLSDIVFNTSGNPRLYAGSDGNGLLQYISTVTSTTTERHYEPTLKCHLSPNPVHTWMRFDFLLPTDTDLSMRIYDLKGQVVARPFVSKHFGAGANSFDWITADPQGHVLPNGVYWYEMVGNASSYTGAFIIQK